VRGHLLSNENGLRIGGDVRDVARRHQLVFDC
jgi:hypothetical protein